MDKSFWRDYLDGKRKGFSMEGWKRTGEELVGVWLREGVEEGAGGVLEEEEREGS